MRGAPKPAGGGSSGPLRNTGERVTTEVFRMGVALCNLHQAGPGRAGRSDGSVSSTFSRVICQKPVLGGYTVLADGSPRDSEGSGNPNFK